MNTYIFSSIEDARSVSSHLYCCIIDCNSVEYQSSDSAAWQTAIKLANVSELEYCRSGDFCSLFVPYIWVTCKEADERGTVHGAWIDCDSQTTLSKIIRSIYSVLESSPCRALNTKGEWRIKKGLNWGDIPIEECNHGAQILLIAKDIERYMEGYSLYLQYKLYRRKPSLDDFLSRFVGFVETLEKFSRRTFLEDLCVCKPFVDWTEVAQYIFFYKGDFISVPASDSSLCIFKKK